MGKRILKQIAYGIFYLALISGISYSIYYWNNRTTCFDGIQNGMEQGLDCGMVCGVACRVFEPLQISEKTFQVLGDDYSLDHLITITNPNQEYGSGDVEFV